MYFLDYAQSFGGAVNTLLQQAVLMREAGQRITVVVSDYISSVLEQGFYQVCADNKIDIIQLTYPISSQPEDIDIVSVGQNYDTIKRKIEEIQPDILHSVQINPTVELVSRELHIPHVMNIYQLLPAFFSINYIDIFPHYHICDSDYFAKEWNHYLGTDSTCIRTVAYSCERVKQSHSESDSVKYICVGSIDKRKKQLEVIKAFSGALCQGVKGHLSIYGYHNGIYAEECKRFILQQGIEEYVTLEGFCADKEEIYQKSDVLICGSTIESYPNVISEALANGLVIISTPVAGVPEVIKDHYNGYVCRGFTKEDILEKILEFEKERKEGNIVEIMNHAYETFEKCHSPQIVTKELLSYYDHLIESYKMYYDISINEIKEEFDIIISKYERHIIFYSDARAVARKIWYIYFIRDIVTKKIVEEEKNLYIWGTGKYGLIVKEIVDTFWDNIHIRGYIDSYKSGTFLEYRIFSPSEILNKSDCIIFIAAVNGQNEIVETLEINQKCYCQDYFILSPRIW